MLTRRLALIHTGVSLAPSRARDCLQPDRPSTLKHDVHVGGRRRQGHRTTSGARRTASSSTAAFGARSARARAAPPRGDLKGAPRRRPMSAAARPLRSSPTIPPATKACREASRQNRYRKTAARAPAPRATQAWSSSAGRTRVPNRHAGFRSKRSASRRRRPPRGPRSRIARARASRGHGEFCPPSRAQAIARGAPCERRRRGGLLVENDRRPRRAAAPPGHRARPLGGRSAASWRKPAYRPRARAQKTSSRAAAVRPPARPAARRPRPGDGRRPAPGSVTGSLVYSRPRRAPLIQSTGDGGPFAARRSGSLANRPLGRAPQSVRDPSAHPVGADGDADFIFLRSDDRCRLVASTGAACAAISSFVVRVLVVLFSNSA